MTDVASPGDGLSRLQRIFDRAVELGRDERLRFLDAACAGDLELRRRVEALLAADDVPILEPPRVAVTETIGATDLPPRLGPFEILSRIGEGGMGIVYEARQENPRRIVALKVIRPGIVSAEVLRRFQQESEVLGQLQHPGIAQVYAAGTVDGRPWFAMELIHGLPLDAWVIQSKPDLRQRLNMMAAICDAVHHAHQKGIVHRDLKPANILVDDAGQPKILDFGVARVTSGDELLATMHTSTGQLVGTLAYMSPEQVGATGGAIDRRSDVYALGVILYELLAGRLPHQLHGHPILEALRIIRDEEPSRLSSIGHHLRGDIETIVAKALAKEPGRRYPSAAELASDIRHYLADEPIIARPPSTLYQVRKFARRNRTLVGGLAAVFVVVVLGAIVATTFAVREARQRALFEREAYRSAIAAASAELRLNNGGRAATILDGTSEKLRGWEWRYLRHSADRSLHTTEVGEQLPVLVVSRDGRRLAGYTASGGIGVWDLESGTRLFRLEGPYERERISLSFSSDAALLYFSNGAANRTRAIVLTDGSTAWELPYSGVGPLSFAPDGSLVFGAAGFAIAVDPLSGKVRRRWPIGVAASEISYLADGQHVAYMTGSGMQIASLPSWTPTYSASRRSYPASAGNALVGELPGGFAELRGPSGQLVARPSVRLFDVHPLDPQLGLMPVTEYGAAVVDAKSGESVATLLGHGSEVVWGGFSRDGTRIFTYTRDGSVRTWDASIPADPWTTLAHASFFAISNDARFAAEAGWGYVRLWNAHTGWPRWTTMLSRRGMNSVAFDATATHIVAVADDGAVFVLDVERGGEHREIAHLPVGALSVAWSPQGKEILAAGVDGTLRILDAASGRELRKLGDDRASAHVVLPLQDGSTTATGGRGPNAGNVVWPTASIRVTGSGGVRLWDTATGRLLRTLDGSTATVQALAATRHRLAAGYANGAVAVWDLRSDQRVDAPATASAVTGLAFDPTEERLIVGRAESIEVLEASTLQSLAVVHAPGLAAHTAAFSENGSLVTAGNAFVLAVFETATASKDYPRRALARRFERSYDLARRALSDPNLLADLEKSPELDATLRAEALDYAKALGSNPNALNSEALAIVRRTDASRADHELAERRIRAALPFRPDDLHFLKTLEMAQFRLGNYRGALATVERAETLLLERGQSPRAADLAVRAISEQAIGERVKARATLERLRTVMRSPEEANEIESRALLVEAELAVEHRARAD